MALPFFYISKYDVSQKEIMLDEDTSRHVTQVLRMKAGEGVNLTDGKGNLISGEIQEIHKKHCRVRVKAAGFKPRGGDKISIALSLLKNSSRFEWFLEKATEIGIMEIIPLICERTEKQKFRFDRMKNICSSAMLQSQQVWLPDLGQPVLFQEMLEQKREGKRFIAHCDDSNKQSLREYIQPGEPGNSLLLIGPEGDFTKNEIASALEHQFIPVSLGNTRLRAETAAVVGAAILRAATW